MLEIVKEEEPWIIKSLRSVNEERDGQNICSKMDL